MYCCTKINDDIIWIGVNDRKTERFENYIPLDNGITYNSYLIMDEKICIIDGVEEGENGNFLGKIEAMIGTAPVDYIIVNHVEPDHSGSIKSMLKIYPELKVVGNAKTIMMLKLLGLDLPDERVVTVKEKDILDFGKTEFDGEGIWISTSLVEASLDIDFDYLFTELQDLNSLFQRFGRCNRKGKKSVDEANCFIYLKIEDKYLKEKGSKYGFIDKDIYENSKKGLENYCKVISKDKIENSQDYNELFQNYSKKITEGDKIKLIEENLSFENLKESNFVDEFEKAYEKYQRILNSDENSQDDLKLRDIQSVTVIPYNIYEKNKENIKELVKKIEDKNLGLEERQEAKTKLLKKTLSIQYYQLSKYISEILKGKADANKYKSENINKSEKIAVMEADYDKELGFRAKDFKDGVPTYEFI